MQSLIHMNHCLIKGKFVLQPLGHLQDLSALPADYFHEIT